MATKATYSSCAKGIHICGADTEEVEPVTDANLPSRGLVH
jgi:hypothetical protein